MVMWHVELWWGVVWFAGDAEGCSNPEESGQTSGLSSDFPDKEVQRWTAVRKNARFPGQVGSTLGTHPEKHAISRTDSYVRVVHVQ